jgi:hypothetical protein
MTSVRLGLRSQVLVAKELFPRQRHALAFGVGQRRKKPPSFQHPLSPSCHGSAFGQGFTAVAFGSVYPRGHPNRLGSFCCYEVRLISNFNYKCCHLRVPSQEGSSHQFQAEN